MPLSFEKTILQSCTGLHRPNKLSSAVVDVVGRWSAPDGSSVEFYRRENETMNLGALCLELFSGKGSIKLGILLDLAHCRLCTYVCTERDP